MASSAFALVGVELYFEDLPRARAFYQEVLGLELAETQEGHHVKFMTPGGFICLEREGVEEYPSADKAVLFFAVTNLSQALERIGSDRVTGAVVEAPMHGRYSTILRDITSCSLSAQLSRSN
jgi:predicted enzyme related to lactoylglutathione lyase